MQHVLTRSKRLAECGAYIQQHAEEVTATWEIQSLREQPEASAEHREQLRNKLPDFLHHFGEWLQNGYGSPADRYAKLHGLQRWEIGWTLESLIRDFQILRRVLILTLHDRCNLTAEDIVVLGATLDEAVTSSVATYVEHSAQELRERNELLRRSNQELRRFAMVIAHEIRNPLSSVTLAARRVRDSIPMHAGSELDAAMAVIERGALTISEVINDLLKYAQLENDAAHDPEPVDLQEVFDVARANLQYAINESGAEITADPLPMVKGHRVALVQLFQNLMENAIKYAGHKQPRLHITVNDHDGTCTLSFTDNGVGIPERYQQAIFRFLSRAHQHLNIPGSGIGLAICRRVAQQHHGEIRVESEEGKGSTFIVTLRDEAEPDSASI